MTYNEFEYYINRLKEVHQLDDDLSEISKKYRNLLMDNYMVAIVLEEDYIKLLEMNLGINDELISWWVYQTDFGKDFKIGDLEDPKEEDENLKTPDLSTVEKLYDYIKILQKNGIYKLA